MISDSYKLIRRERVGAIQRSWKLTYQSEQGTLVYVLLPDSVNKAPQVFNKNGIEIASPLSGQLIRRSEEYLGYY